MTAKTFEEKFPELKKHITFIDYDGEEYNIKRVCGCNDDWSKPLSALNTEPLELFYGDEQPFKEQVVSVTKISNHTLSRQRVREAIEKLLSSNYREEIAAVCALKDILTALGLDEQEGEE